MKIAACKLSIVPLRAEAAHRSEMVSQVLFAEVFEILEETTDFSRVRLLDTGYEGWIQKGTFDILTSSFGTKFIVDIKGAVAADKELRVNLLHGTPVSIEGLILESSRM